MCPEAPAPRCVADEVGVILRHAAVVHRLLAAGVPNCLDGQPLAIVRPQLITGLQLLRRRPASAPHPERMLRRRPQHPPDVAAIARLIGLSRKSVYKALEPTRDVA